jgi:hypothetical protein
MWLTLSLLEEKPAEDSEDPSEKSPSNEDEMPSGGEEDILPLQQEERTTHVKTWPVGLDARDPV